MGVSQFEWLVNEAPDLAMPAGQRFDLADAVGLTEKRLNTGFRRVFGATTFDVLRNQRLDHARQALAEGALSRKEVSFRVGYNHVSNFVHAFRARYGAPPAQFISRAPRGRAPR